MPFGAWQTARFGRYNQRFDGGTMTSSRSVAWPIVVGTTLWLVLICGFVTMVADAEFHYAVRTVDRINQGTPLSAMGELFRQRYSMAWILPVAAALVGALVLRRPQVRFAILVWYVMIFVLAGSAALLGILFVWYSMDTAFYVGLQK